MHLSHKFFGLGRDRRGTAALEFALIAGLFLIPVFYGVYDITEEVIFYQEVYNAAHSIAASASNLAAQANGSTTLNFTQIEFLESEIWGEIPTLRGDYQDGLKSVTISSIVFEPTQATGVCGATNPCYIPVTVWSVLYTGGDSGRTLATGSYNAHTFYYVPISTGAATFSTAGSAASQVCGSSGQSGTTGTSQCNTGIIGNNSPSGSGAYAGGVVPDNPLRPCDGGASIPAASTLIGSLNQTSNTGGNASDLTSLRTLSLTGTSTTAPPSPILVVDVRAQFTPPIDIIQYGANTFYATAFWPVRSVQSVVTGTTTPLALYNQFTTINKNSVLSGVNYTYYCLNNTLAGAGI